LAFALVLAAVLAGASSACGSDDREKPAARNERLAQQRPQRQDAEDGRLTTTTGEVITNFGSRRAGRQAVRGLVQLQRDFRSGRMTAACTRISDFMLSQFTPAGTKPDTPCPAKLEAYAGQLAERGTPAARLRLLWVRSYTGEAGIWVDDERGRRLRIPFSSSTGHGNWQLDLGSFEEPAVLAATLSTRATSP
jgi:hypothetical protein